MATLAHAHVELDDRGVPRFTGTRFKIIHVIIEHTRWKWSVEAIHFQHPDLTLAQIHSALAYYYDHQQEIDAEIERRDRETQALRKETENPALHDKLRQIAAERSAST